MEPSGRWSQLEPREQRATMSHLADRPRRNDGTEVYSGTNGSPFQAWTNDNSGQGELMVTRAGDEGLRRGSAVGANELDSAGGVNEQAQHEHTKQP